MNAKEKITKARAGLILDLPFFGSLALRLEVVEDATCETAWTDGRRMGYNPDFIESLSLAEVKGLICHEVMHCAAAHQARRGDRDHRKWNAAGDYAINQIIEDCKIPLPEGRLIDPAYTGMSAEAIYSKLPAPPPTPSSGGESTPSYGHPSRGEDSAGGGAGGGNSPLEGAGGGNPPAEKGDQPGGSDPGRCGEVRDTENPQSATGNQQSEQDWKIAVAQAAQEARMQGKLPASIARMVADVLEAKADWREILRRFVDQTAKNDYSWSPPNRRYVHMGLYLPSLRSEELAPIVVAVDTSVSISGKEIDQFAAELTAILEEHDTTCTVIYCDSAIAHIETHDRASLPLQLHPKGGGGTDFRPPFDWVRDIFPSSEGAGGGSPSCMIYLTDLECSDYPPEPHYPVLWAHLGKSGTKPPFGEVVKL